MFLRLLLILLIACSEYRLKGEDAPADEESYQDLDGDGYYTDDGVDTDCDDNHADTHPGATELCDERDNDCDGEVDEGAVDANIYYRDQDGDSFGNARDELASCAAEAPFGYVNLEKATDCRDDMAAVHPAAHEVCLDGLDNDCDDFIDEDDAADSVVWFLDADGDGYGGLDGTTMSCEAPPGYADNTDDCDDSDGAVYPGQYEVCNGYDDDCDALVDDADLDLDAESDTFLTGAVVLYPDNDGDGYGNPEIGTEVRACDTGVYPDYVETPDDCDDLDATIPYALPHRDDIVLIGFSSTTPLETVEIGGWTLLRLSYIEEISVGQYLTPSDLDECYFVVNGEASGEYGYVELDYTFFEPASAPAVNDPLHAALQWNLDAIGAEDAWQCSTGEGVKVAVIDSGVSASAYDGFGDRLEEGYGCDATPLYCLMRNVSTNNYEVREKGSSAAACSSGELICSFVHGSADYSSGCDIDVGTADNNCRAGGQHDTSGHGTHVAGTIGQAANNGIGVAGLAPDAVIVPYDLDEGITVFSSFDQSAALKHIWDRGDISVANISLGPTCKDNDGACLSEEACRTQLGHSQLTLLAALQYAAEQGIFVALAAGNVTGCITDQDMLPAIKAEAASIGGVMVVGNAMRDTMSAGAVPMNIASTDDITLNAGSLYGDDGDVEIVAPGTDIFQGYDGTHCSGDSAYLYCRLDGTSMASPHVAAAAALLSAEGATNTQIETYLRDSAAFESGWSTAQYGAGLLRPDLALEAYLSSARGATVECDFDGTVVASWSSGSLAAAFMDETEDYSWIYNLDSFAEDFDTEVDALLFGDVDRDHRDDIIHFNYTIGAVQVALSVFRNDLSAAIGSQSQVEHGPWSHIDFPSSCGSEPLYAVGDLNLDRATDLIIDCDGHVYGALATDSDDADVQPDHFADWIDLAQLGDRPDGDGGCELCGDDVRLFVANQEGDSYPELIYFIGGDWYSFPVDYCDDWALCGYGYTERLFQANTGDDSDFDDPGGGSDGESRDVWYQSYVADLDDDGYVDLVNFYNDGDWFVSLSNDSYPQDGVRWAQSAGDFADVALFGDVTADGLADVVTLYYDDDHSIACEMTGCMLEYCAERGWYDSDADGVVDAYYYDPSCPREEIEECEPASSVRAEYRRGFPDDSDGDGVYDGLSTTDCDGGYGGLSGTLDCAGNNASEWFVQPAEDASGSDGIADRFTPLADSGGRWREACLSEDVDGDRGYDRFFVPYAIVDINGDGFGDLTGRTNDGNWRAILNLGEGG